MRENKKQQLISHESSIKKSNEISMARLNNGLTLNQMQLLAYAIYSTQQDGKTEFNKHEFEKKFNLDYKTKHAKEDAMKITSIQFSIEDLENDYFEYWNVFKTIKYDKGAFTFRWNEEFIPHILELKDKYVLTDLTITSNFKSGFSWILYEYLKGHYGNWHKELTKEAMMRLFSVESVKSYQRNTALLKVRVLELAIKEINEHTELEVWYTENKIGNKITGFVLHWSTGDTVASATEKQIKLLKEIHDEVEKSMFDYLAVKKVESARDLIIKIKEINTLVKKGMSIKEADNYIQESLAIYRQLEKLLERDGEERDTSIYYNWLEEIDN